MVCLQKRGTARVFLLVPVYLFSLLLAALEWFRNECPKTESKEVAPTNLVNQSEVETDVSTWCKGWENTRAQVMVCFGLNFNWSRMWRDFFDQ